MATAMAGYRRPSHSHSVAKDVSISQFLVALMAVMDWKPVGPKAA